MLMLVSSDQSPSAPTRLAIIDESPQPKISRQALMQQQGTAAPAVTAPREVHLRLEVVSLEFEGQSMIKRQRRIYQVDLVVLFHMCELIDD